MHGEKVKEVALPRKIISSLNCSGALCTKTFFGGDRCGAPAAGALDTPSVLIIGWDGNAPYPFVIFQESLTWSKIFYRLDPVSVTHPSNSSKSWVMLLTKNEGNDTLDAAYSTAFHRAALIQKNEQRQWIDNFQCFNSSDQCFLEGHRIWRVLSVHSCHINHHRSYMHKQLS